MNLQSLKLTLYCDGLVELSTMIEETALSSPEFPSNTHSLILMSFNECYSSTVSPAYTLINGLVTEERMPLKVLFSNVIVDKRMMESSSMLWTAKCSTLCFIRLDSPARRGERELS